MSVCLPICLNAQLSETIKVRMLRLSIPILEILAQFKIFSAGFYPLYNAHKPLKTVAPGILKIFHLFFFRKRFVMQGNL